MKFHLLSLGCLKNTADSMRLTEGLKKKGMLPVENRGGADVLIVNTCGFIEDAKKESIEEILRLADDKNGKKLIVMGCLAKRYGKELQKEIPEIDGLYGVGEAEMARLIEGVSGPFSIGPAFGGSAANVTVSPLAGGPRPQSRVVADPTVPLKIAEGCNRKCSFCVIPSIRGPFRGRRPEDILDEAERLVKAGAKEISLVAQDLTGFGKNTGYGLTSLLKDIASISGDFWIRPLYLYPTGVDDSLLRVIAEEEKICNYIDMPLQHSEDKMLRLMKRAGSRKQYLGLIKRIREAVPDAAIRTAFIVGFPGETERDFKGLLDFIEEAEFDRLGAFKYSREEGTPAYSMKGRVSERVKERRHEELMGLQSDISLRKNKALIGRRFRALMDKSGTARIYSHAEEVDGITIIKGRKPKAGGFVDVLITGASHYDIEAVMVK